MVVLADRVVLASGLVSVDVVVSRCSCCCWWMKGLGIRSGSLSVSTKYPPSMWWISLRVLIVVCICGDSCCC